MRFIIDMDDVLAETSIKWIESYNKDYKDDLIRESVKSWGWHEYVKCGWKIYDYLDQHNFFFEIEPIEGAIEGMEKLIMNGHDVIIATATPIDSTVAHEEKKEWIRFHLPFFDLKNFASLARKDILCADLMFDDAPHNLNSFQGITVCMDRPWNKNCKSTFRVSNWEDFLDIVTKLEEEEEHAQFGELC